MSKARKPLEKPESLKEEANKSSKTSPENTKTTTSQSPEPQKTVQNSPESEKLETKKDTKHDTNQSEVKNTNNVPNKSTITYEKKNADKPSIDKNSLGKSSSGKAEAQSTNKVDKILESKVNDVKGSSSSTSTTTPVTHSVAKDDIANKSSKSLARTALLFGLGGLGLSGYQLMNTDQSAITQVSSQMTETRASIDSLSQANSTLDKKMTDMSAKVGELSKAMSAQPAQIERALSTKLSDTLGKSLQTSVMKDVNQVINQAKSEFAASTKQSEQKFADATVQFEQKVQHVGGQLSAFAESDLMNMDVNDIRNAQETINSRVDTAFANLTDYNVKKMQKLSASLVQESENVHLHFDEGKKLFAEETQKIKETLSKAEQQMQLSRIEYLLDMANNKIVYENAPEQAKALLIQAQSQLEKVKGAEQFSVELANTIDALSVIQPPNKSSLYEQIDNAIKLVPELAGKTNKVKEVDTEKSGSLAERLSNKLQSSLLEVPKDKNVLKVTPESAEYARQNVKLNLNFIKYAVATDNQNLLTSNLTALQNNLSVAFDDSDALQQLNQVKTMLEKVKLNVSYPQLSNLKNNFTQLYQALNSAGEQQQ